MSTALCENTHINALVNLCCFGPRPMAISLEAARSMAKKTGKPHTVENWSGLIVPFGGRDIRMGEHCAEHIGAVLLDENINSIRHSYPHKDLSDWIDDKQFVWERLAAIPTALEGLVVISCYEYQLCDYPGWPTSEAYFIIQELRSRIVDYLPGLDELSAYCWQWRE